MGRNFDSQVGPLEFLSGLGELYERGVDAPIRSGLEAYAETDRPWWDIVPFGGKKLYEGAKAAGRSYFQPPEDAPTYTDVGEAFGLPNKTLAEYTGGRMSGTGADWSPASMAGAALTESVNPVNWIPFLAAAKKAKHLKKGDDLFDFAMKGKHKPRAVDDDVVSVSEMGKEERDALFDMLDRWKAREQATTKKLKDTHYTLMKGDPGVVGRDLVDMAMEGKKVYHGSPHRFESFDMNRVGTGEGAQAFGHGLYFTDDIKIADTYSDIDKLVNKFEYTGADMAQDMGNKLRGEIFEKGSIDEAAFVNEITNSVQAESNLKGLSNYDKEQMVLKVSEDIKKYIKDNNKKLSELLERSTENPGKVIADKYYEDVDMEKFATKFKPERTVYTARIPGGDYLKWDDKLPYKQEKKLVDYATKEAKDFDLVKNVSDAPTAKELYERLIDYTGSPQEASKLLNKVGFKGIEYPAGTLSGVKGSKAKNYVVFSDKGITIDDIKKLMLLGGAGIGGAEVLK